MARGKRAEGAEAARFCALYGLPKAGISYGEYVALTLCEDSAVAALARVGVTAGRILSGGVGPREYYASEQQWLEALLRSRLARAG